MAKESLHGFGKVEEFAPLLYVISLGCLSFVELKKNSGGRVLNIIKGK